MTTTLENTVTDLVTQTNKLTNEVIGKMATIDQRVTDAETELDNHWTAKSAQIDSEWAAKQIEIDAKLNAFDNQIIYVAPTAQNDATGVDAENATTLADALSKHLIPSVANTIKLSKGLHVLPAQALNDLFLLNFEPTDDYDPDNPPIICTPNTVDSQISTNSTGISSPSQICEAHAYDEIPLSFNNSTVRFNNVWLRGTRHCLNLDKSTIFTLGDMHLDLWIYSASCTSHSGIALQAKDSTIYSDADLDINVWHPDYTGCTDVLADHAAPILLDSSKHIQKGQLTWSSNIELNEYPKQNCIGWRTETETAHATAINLINGAQLHIDRLMINNVMQLFWADDSIINVGFMEMAEHSEPLQWLGQARGQHAQVSFTNRSADWYNIDDTNVVRIENTGTNPDQASLIAYEGAQVYLDGVKFTTTECPCNSFMTTETAQVLLQNSIIYAPDRDNNQGFLHISHNTDGHVLAKNNQLTTRLGDDDVGFVTVKGGFTREENNQFNFSQDYSVDTYGRHQDSFGNTKGMYSFSEDKTIKIPEDYPDLESAIAAISDLVVAPSASITLELAEGKHVLSQSLAIENVHNITVKGAEPISKTLVSFVSATGSAGNWDVTLQLHDMTDVNVGDYLLIHDVTGTGTPEVHLGGWEVIAVSGSNVTIKHYCPEATFPTNTITSGSLYLTKTIINSHSILIDSCSKLELKNIVLEKLSLSVTKSDVSLSHIGLSQHIFNTFNSNIELNLLTACRGTYYGMYFIRTTVNSTAKVLSNSNQYHGVHLLQASTLNFNANLIDASLYSLFNVRYGIYARESCNVRLSYSASLPKEYYILNNQNTDIYAINNSFINIEKIAGSPTFSPALNTVGNKQSYIAG
ncbi:hypothetical protein [Candidatus Albibeggiatoa sp. nov. NOAA]|uniref:hypothetical protein n=1 Tax=Candidatus Albibeggiatoa sp. nov. NOAA TaxID=3162724 RepID=UPI0032F73C83|nr:hypothetical protein [Thiotrichaceae bacterium]